MKCDRCHLTIAPHDPEKINIGRLNFHGGCWKKHLRQVKDAQTQKEPAHDQRRN